MTTDTTIYDYKENRCDSRYDISPIISIRCVLEKGHIFYHKTYYNNQMYMWQKSDEELKQVPTGEY